MQYEYIHQEGMDARRVGSGRLTSNFPTSAPPLVRDSAYVVVGTAESGRFRVTPTVALAVRDDALRDSLASALHEHGVLVGGEDVIDAAVVVIADARAGAANAVAALRSQSRSDAAIILVVEASVPASELDAAYEAGAMLCLRSPFDVRQLDVAVASTLELHAAKVDVLALKRQLDVQTHLATLGRVTAGFTHEVANPLSTLTGCLDFIRPALDRMLGPPAASTPAPDGAALASPEMVRGALDDMGTSLERLRVLLERTRELSRAGRSARLANVGLAEAVRDVCAWSSDELQGVTLQQQIDEPLVVLADRWLLTQILMNLIANAAHAAKQLPSPRVRVHVYASQDYALVSVRDNGPGIPPELRERIFEPFFTTRRSRGGTGLGLALCREYAMHMRAHLTLWTAVGRGACFRVHLRRGT